MPEINVTSFGGGGRQNISIKNEDGSSVFIKVRPGKTEVTTTSSDGETHTETHETGGGGNEAGGGGNGGGNTEGGEK